MKNREGNKLFYFYYWKDLHKFVNMINFQRKKKKGKKKEDIEKLNFNFSEASSFHIHHLERWA